MRSATTRPRGRLALAGAFALVLAACASPGAPTSAPTDADIPSDPPAASPTGGDGGSPPPAEGGTDLTGASFTVGSKEFTEQLILGQIAKAVLEDAGATVEDQTGLVGSTVVREALTNGDIDMYWEYTGTGWITHLGNETPVTGSQEQYEAVREADAANDIVWLEPAPLNNTYAIAVASETAADLGLTTISDLEAYAAENPEGATLCAASEFLDRDDGLPGLQEAYGFEFSDVATLELGLIPVSIDAATDCVFGEVFATDARIAELGLVVLEDDQSFFPVYQPSLNVRQEGFGANPGLAELFAPVAEALDTETMQTLNARVDVDGEEADAVAVDFLTEEGLIGE